MPNRLSDFLVRTALSSLITLRAIAAPVSVGACALALDRKGRVLLVRHSYQPGWLLPGGAVGRGEPPADAVMRELREEVGLKSSSEPEYFSLYTRRVGFATNLIVLFRLTEVEIAFRPNFEVVEAVFADPFDLPKGTTRPTVRRIRELAENLPRALYW